MISTTNRSARVTTVTSGKGGVGKTVIGANLAVALAKMGQQAMLVDADLGLANANIVLGLYAATTIEDVLFRGCEMPAIVQHGPSGVYIVPGHSGGGSSPWLGERDRNRLADCFRPYARKLDHVLVDTATGISPQILSLAATSDQILLVLTDEPTAFMGAYAQVKALVADHGCTSVSVVTNLVEDDRAGRRLFSHFEEVVTRFLDVELDHIGSIPRDDHVRKAVSQRRCCIEAFPLSRASVAISNIAATLVERAVPLTAGGHRFFGMEAQHGSY